MFAFAFSGMPGMGNVGWRVYRPETEFRRQVRDSAQICQFAEYPQHMPATWRISRINEAFAMSPTYPCLRTLPLNNEVHLLFAALIAVPAEVTDEALARVAQFRSKGRLPGTALFHRSAHIIPFPADANRRPFECTMRASNATFYILFNKLIIIIMSPRIAALSWVSASGASITRCSQPKVGVASKRSPDDEALVAAILRTNTADASRLLILDARPRANAVANHAKVRQLW